MRIGLFADSYVPQVSGVVTVVRELKEGLERLGHTVFVFTVSHKDALPNPSVIRLKSVQFPNEPQHRIGFFTHHELLKKAKELNLDIIHTHTEFSLYIAAKVVAKKFKLPMVHTLHTYYPDYLYYVPLLQPFLKNREHKLIQKVLKGQRCVIAPSYKIYNYLQSHGFSIPLHVVPNGIDLSAFNKDHKNRCAEAISSFKAGHKLMDNEELIVFVGRLAIEKNIETLLLNFKNILQHRPKARLLLVGDGPDRLALERHSNKLGIDKQVSFLGYLKWPDEVSACYASAKLFMSASHSEVHPITFIEAMAAGLPIVCANDISIKDMVLNGENGWALDDDHKLWEKAVEILADPELAKRMGARSEELSNNYSIETFVTRMEAIYKEFVK